MAKEHRVFVMWADAARADAHNLNHLLEEWSLRHEEVSSQRENSQGDLLPSLMTRDYTSPPSLDISLEWRKDLLQRLGEVESWLTRKKVNWVQCHQEGYRN